MQHGMLVVHVDQTTRDADLAGRAAHNQRAGVAFAQGVGKPLLFSRPQEIVYLGKPEIY